jgi:hypothetical protein
MPAQLRAKLGAPLETIVDPPTDVACTRPDVSTPQKPEGDSPPVAKVKGADAASPQPGAQWFSTLEELPDESSRHHARPALPQVEKTSSPVVKLQQRRIAEYTAGAIVERLFSAGWQKGKVIETGPDGSLVIGYDDRTFDSLPIASLCMLLEKGQLRLADSKGSVWAALGKGNLGAARRQAATPANTAARRKAAATVRKGKGTPVNSGEAENRRPQQDPTSAHAKRATVWTKSDREALRRAMERYQPTEPNYWDKVASHVPRKSSAECAEAIFGVVATPVGKKRKAEEEAPEKIAQKNGPRRMKQVRQLLQSANFDGPTDFFAEEGNGLNDEMFDIPCLKTGLTPGSSASPVCTRSPSAAGLFSPGSLPDETCADVREVEDTCAQMDGFLHAMKDKSRCIDGVLCRPDRPRVAHHDAGNDLSAILRDSNQNKDRVGQRVDCGWKAYGYAEDDNEGVDDFDDVHGGHTTGFLDDF